jgi:hypothetical protein
MARIEPELLSYPHTARGFGSMRLKDVQSSVGTTINRVLIVAQSGIRRRELVGKEDSTYQC